MSARNSLSRPEASQYLWETHGVKRSPGTLAKQASQGGGPKYRRVGLRQVIYDVPHLDEYAKSIVTAPAANSKEHDARTATDDKQGAVNRAEPLPTT